MLEDRFIYPSNYDVSAVLSKISNRPRNLSKKKLNKSNLKRNAALFLIHVCRKNIDNLQCTRFYVIWNSCEYRVQYFELQGLGIWLKSN